VIKFDHSRIKELADAISQIPIGTFYSIDMMEPEYKTFDNLHRKYSTISPYKFDNTLALLGIGTGLIDYQQRDPGRTVWQPLEKLVHQHGFPSTLDEIMRIHLQLAGLSRFATHKTTRVKKMYQSGFASRFWNGDITENRKEPYRVWMSLARSMGDPVDKKTIVMAMKAFDIETLAVKKHYLPFPSDIPIMVDSRITYVSLSSGIVNTAADMTIDAIASSYRSEIIRAWSEVIAIAKQKIGEEFNALRLDSLIWQAGEHRSRDAVISYLRKMQLPSELSVNIAEQLIWKNI